MTRLLLGIAVVLALLAAALYLFQGKLIYFPRRYPFPPERLPAGIEALRFRTAAGDQVAFYLPPRAERARLWMTFGGNAMAALDWLDWVSEDPDPNAAYLLFDYPGEGF